MTAAGSDNGGWRRLGRRATGALLILLGALALPVGVVVLAGGGAEVVVAEGGDSLPVWALLVVGGALALIAAGTAVRPGEPEGPDRAATDPSGADEAPETECSATEFSDTGRG